ncbi:MAG: hypothetical protein WC141_03475 [Arcobacteraceae bacterium]
MKKLDVISNKIKSNKPNYFGRGHFESVIKENSKQILKWFEELIPVQEQIKELIEMGCEDLQKRNYVRIITKLFPKEYAQFIALNIMLRDIDSISAVFKGIYDTRKQYDTLLEHNKLKYPGKHQRYVDFHTYQQFVSFYKDDLINRAINFEIDSSIEIEPNQQFIYNVHAKKKEEPVIIEEVNTPTIMEEEIEEKQKQEIEELPKEELTVVSEIPVSEEAKVETPKPLKEKTNWMKVLLKGV